MTKKTEHWVFVDKKIDQDKELKKVAIYGSITELHRDNDIGYTPNWIRELLHKNLNHFENENICIKKCEVQRSKRKKLKL